MYPPDCPIAPVILSAAKDLYSFGIVRIAVPNLCTITICSGWFFTTSQLSGLSRHFFMSFFCSTVGFFPFFIPSSPCPLSAAVLSWPRKEVKSWFFTIWITKERFPKDSG